MSLYSDLFAMVKQIIADIPFPRNEEGFAVSGAWDSSTGRTQHVVGDTGALVPAFDGGDQPITLREVPQAGQYGDQYGARGNERVVLLPTATGYVSLFIHDQDDSPGAPAGERWIIHRDATGAIDAITKYKNTGSIDHVASEVGLGDEFANLAAIRAAIVNDDATTLTNNIRVMAGTVALQVLQALATAGSSYAATALTTVKASGLPAATTTTAVSDSVPAVTVPSGSASVRIKP